jgi:hypothetical protein
MRAWTIVRITLAVAFVHVLALGSAPASSSRPASAGRAGARPVVLVVPAAPHPRGAGESLDSGARARAAWNPAELAVVQAAMDPRLHARVAPAPAGPRSMAASARRRASTIYATRPPPSATLAYRLHQSNPDGRTLDGPAQLEWRVDPAGYTLRLALQPRDGPARSWTSEGTFDRGGLAPHRLVQQDGVRLTHRLELASASVAPAAPGLAAGSQDRWSWLAQLAAILEARPGTPPPRVDLDVTGLRGDVEQWRFTSRGAAGPPPPATEGEAPSFIERRQAARLLLMVREPERPFDLEVEAWLDPARHHWPVALRLSTPPSRWTFYLYLYQEPRPHDS